MKRNYFKFIFILILLLFTRNTYALDGNFTELQNIINLDSGEIKLEKDYVNNGLESQIEINKDLTLDLNGHVIDAKSISRVFFIHDCNVTITDTSENVIHKFDTVTQDDKMLATLNETSGTLSVNGGCITGGNADANGGAAIYLSNANLTIEAGNIIGNQVIVKNGSGGGIHALNNSKVIMNGGSIMYNFASWEALGGGIYVNGSELIMNNGSISYNFGIYGGGINVHNSGKLTINDGLIKGNRVGHNGAGMALYNSTTIINGGVIEENINPATWIGFGGGISTEVGATLTINDVIIRNNKANRGAGIAAWTGGNIKIYGGTITGNVSTEDTSPSGPNTFMNYGGGIFFDTSYSGYAHEVSSLTLGKDVVIENNYNEVTDKEENIYLTDGQIFNIGTGIYAPTSKMKIGITMANNTKVFTNNLTDDYSENFKDDTNNLIPVMIDSKLKLSSFKTITILDHEGLIVTVHDDTLNKDFNPEKVGNNLEYKIPLNDKVTITFDTKTNYYFKEDQEEIEITSLIDNQTITYNEIIKVNNPQTGDNLFIELIIVFSTILTFIQIIIIYRKKFIY